jgi:UDP:flavonoid glycosyltransferase YjiC (YdhE family)
VRSLDDEPRRRFLFTTLPYVGHLHGLVPLAAAVAAAGHEVRFAAMADFCETIRGWGFDCIPAGFPTWDAVRADLPGVQSSGDVYIAMAERVATDLVEYFDQWLPDAVVRDPLEYGGCIAAEAAGLPHAVGRMGALWPPSVRRSMADDGLSEVRARFGLPDDPEAAMLYRYLALAFVSPELVGKSEYIEPVTHFIRPTELGSPLAETGPAWHPPPAHVPFVYATFGTVFNRYVKTLQLLARALAGQPYYALLTVGPRVELTSFPWVSTSTNLQVRNYVPQERVLPYCDAVVAHGGFHTVIGALMHGVPMLLLPQGGDHSRNAGWCSEQGAALVLEGPHDDKPAIRAGVIAVLEDPSYKENAERIRTDFASLPDVNFAVRLLEQLAATREPILNPRVV